MVFNLGSGRNDLVSYMETEIPLQELLVEGRILESDFHDGEGCAEDHMHWHKKVLRTYDPKTDKVLLSKQGSRMSMANLDEPDREYSRQELVREADRMSWKVREKGSELF